MPDPAVYDALVRYTMTLESLEAERKEVAARYRDQIRETRHYIKEAVRRLNGEEPQLRLPFDADRGGTLVSATITPTGTHLDERPYTGDAV